MLTKPFAIFDMDGTLVDSMGCWNDVSLEYLKAHGAGDSAEALVAKTAHMTTDEAAALFSKRLLPGVPPKEIAAALDARMEALYRSTIREKPGVRAYLERLKSRGVSMCVASSTPEPLIRACLDRLALAPFFSFILSCDAVGAGKDDPAVYLTAAKRLGALPSQIAVYEDAPVALSTAKGAGFYAVAVYDDTAAVHWPKLCEIADAAISDWRLV